MSSDIDKENTDKIISRNTAMKKTQTEDTCFALVESTSDSMYLVDENCRYLFINSQHLSRLGVPTADIIGRSYGDFHSPEDTEVFVEKVKQVFTTGKSVQHEHQSARDNRYFLRTFSPVREIGPEGKITSLAIVSKDITERRQAEELYKTLAESSLAAVFIVQDGKFRFINTSAVVYAGYTAAELIGLPSDMIVHPEDRDVVKKKGREMLRGKDVTPFEFRIVTKEGQIRWIMQIVSPIRYKGKPAILGNAVDITVHKQAEEERERLIIELKDALSKIRTLRGLLPICASCKKIRDDKGYWEQIELYISDHSEAEFSHGLCPECVEKFYPEFSVKK